MSSWGGDRPGVPAAELHEAEAWPSRGWALELRLQQGSSRVDGVLRVWSRWRGARGPAAEQSPTHCLRHLTRESPLTPPPAALLRGVACMSTVLKSTGLLPLVGWPWPQHWAQIRLV